MPKSSPRSLDAEPFNGSASYSNSKPNDTNNTNVEHNINNSSNNNNDTVQNIKNDQLKMDPTSNSSSKPENLESSGRSTSNFQNLSLPIPHSYFPNQYSGHPPSPYYHHQYQPNNQHSKSSSGGNSPYSQQYPYYRSQSTSPGNSRSRLYGILDMLRSEFDGFLRDFNDNYHEDYQLKFNNQITNLSVMQQSIFELEQAHRIMKQDYESAFDTMNSEIAELRLLLKNNNIAVPQSKSINLSIKRKSPSLSSSPSKKLKQTDYTGNSDIKPKQKRKGSKASINSSSRPTSANGANGANGV